MLRSRDKTAMEAREDRGWTGRGITASSKRGVVFLTDSPLTSKKERFSTFVLSFFSIRRKEKIILVAG